MGYHHIEPSSSSGELGFVVRPVWVLSLGLKSRTNPLAGMVSELQGVVW